MNLLIDDIISELRNKYKEEKIEDWWNNKIELKRIISSQFKVIRTNIEDKSLTPVNLIYLGKVNPTKWFKYNKSKYSILTSKEKNARNKEYYKRLNKESRDREDSKGVNTETSDLL